MQERAERRALSLLQEQAGDMLRMCCEADVVVRSWKVHRIHHRPGAGVSVGYSVIVDDTAARERRSIYMVASTGNISDKHLQRVAAKKLRLGDLEVKVWEYPADPELPALPLACNQQKMSAFLGESVDLELLGYRPTRRAIFRIDRQQAAPLYGKVICPARQADLERRLQVMEKFPGGAPQVFRTAPGLVLMTAVPGISLARYFIARSTLLPNGLEDTLQSLYEALQSLPAEVMDFPPRPAWAEKCEHYGVAAALRLPAEAQRCRQAAADIRALLRLADLGPLAPVHGDFYEANICIDPQCGQVTGLLDLDSLSPGRRVYDWGCLLGHMSVLYQLAPRLYPQVPQLLPLWFSEISHWEDGVALAAAAAGVTLSLIAGARKNTHLGKNSDAEAQARLRITEEWIAAAFALQRGNKAYIPGK